MGIVEQIVNRCHVGASDRAVIGEVVAALKEGRRTFFSLPRERRRELMTRAVEQHRQNRQLYDDVTRGNI